MKYNNEDICRVCGTYAKTHFIKNELSEASISVMNHPFIVMTEEDKKKYFEKKNFIINMIDKRVCKMCNLPENDHKYQVHNFKEYNIYDSLKF